MTDPATTIREALKWMEGTTSQELALAALTELEQQQADADAGRDKYIALAQRMEQFEREQDRAWDYEHKMMERATEAEEKLEAAERERDRLQEDYEISHRRVMDYAAELDTVRSDRDRLADKLDTSRAYLKATQKEADQLADTLRELLGAIGNPEDVDQDCRFCAGHYGQHLDGCVWAAARAALDRHTQAVGE